MSKDIHLIIRHSTFLLRLMKDYRNALISDNDYKLEEYRIKTKFTHLAFQFLSALTVFIKLIDAILFRLNI